jgi:NitT/TauT family transport system ATP-binding protein
VLDHFSLTLDKNGFTVLIGPSGCGKSTFFDLLTGVVPKDGGSIRWNGKDLIHLGERAAYMQQKDLLLPWLSLMENALLPSRISREPLEEAVDRARTFFARLGIEGFENYRPGKVSGGMRQRCALVRTLMFKRELVLLDEPLSAIDAITRRGLQSLLLLLQSEFEKSILMITHDVEEALLLADELLVLTHSPMRIKEQLKPESAKPRKIGDPQLLKMKEYILEVLQKDNPNGIS